MDATPFDEPDWDATMARGEDPFGDDPFDSTRETFPTVEWVIGRLVLIYPEEILDLKNKSGEPYQAVSCRVVVLDGETTEDIPKVPYVIEQMRFNSDSIIGEVKRLIGKGRPNLSRVNETPSKRNEKIMARFLSAPTDEDKRVARRYLASQLPV